MKTLEEVKEYLLSTGKVAKVIIKNKSHKYPRTLFAYRDKKLARFFLQEKYHTEMPMFHIEETCIDKKIIDEYLQWS